MNLFCITILFILVSCGSCVEDLLSERLYTYPHYTEVAPCSCDMTQGKCDTSCCCDPDCPPQASLNTTCTPGLRGGHDLGKILSLNCSSNSSFLQDLGHPHLGLSWLSFRLLLCVHTHNTPYIGQYFSVKDKAKEQTYLDNLKMAAETAGKSSYEESDAVGGRLNKSSDTEPYKHGVAVKTVFNRNEGIKGRLEMPVGGIEEGCVSAPIVYLEDRRSSCSRLISREKCQQGKNSVFDHQMYLIDFPGIEGAPNVPQVLALNNKLNTSRTRVKYFSTTTPHRYVHKYKQTKNKKNEATAEEVDDIEELVLLSRQDLSPRKFQENVDNAECEEHGTPSYFASYDPEEDVCRNIVLEVRYNLVWAATEIREVDVEILMGNISLAASQAEEIYVRQFYQNKFIHTNKTDKQLEEEEREKPILRSGNPGYDIGKPLIFANYKFDNLSDREESNETVTLDSHGFRIWGHNKADTSCLGNKLTSPEFGINIQTGCYIRLAQDNITNCDHLASSIAQLQDSLMISEAVARDGTFNTTDPAQFFKIIYEDTTHLRPASPSLPISSCHVQSSVRVTVMFTHSGEHQGRPIHLLVGVRVSPQWERWSWWCPGVPGGCPPTKRFQLSTQVEFLEVPAVWRFQNTSRFWVGQEDVKCGDHCWDELFLPLTHSRTGDDVAEAVEWGMAAVVVAASALYAVKAKRPS